MSEKIRKAWCDQYGNAMAQYEDHTTELATLRADNERMRAALERIDHGWETPMEDKAWRALARFMWETARAALAQEKQNE